MRHLAPSLAYLIRCGSLACAGFVAACGSGTVPTSGGTTLDPATGQPASDTPSEGLDCAALTQHFAAANCPKFDSAKYEAECEQTRSNTPAACTPQADAVVKCGLNQTIECKANGDADDDLDGCKAEIDAFLACAGGK